MSMLLPKRYSTIYTIYITLLALSAFLCYCQTEKVPESVKAPQDRPRNPGYKIAEHSTGYWVLVKTGRDGKVLKWIWVWKRVAQKGYDSGRRCYECLVVTNKTPPECCGHCKVCQMDSGLIKSRRNWCLDNAKARKCALGSKLTTYNVNTWGPGCVLGFRSCVISSGLNKAACGECAIVCALPPTGPIALSAAAFCAVAFAKGL